MLTLRFKTASASLLSVLLYAVSSFSAAEPISITDKKTHLSALREKTGLPIINTLPLPASCFTQGFTIDGNKLYLSCGQYKHSTVYIYALSNKPSAQLTQLHKINLPASVFAEGIAVTPQYIYLLSWKNQTMLRFNKQEPLLANAKTWTYSGEGWGLSFDANKQQLLFSNGSKQLHAFSEPENSTAIQLKPIASVAHLDNINELEVVKENLLFNRWFDKRIYVIALASLYTALPKQVQARYIDLTPLSNLHTTKNVLNGIAYDARDDSLWFTGKNWGVAYQMQASEFFKLLQ